MAMNHSYYLSDNLDELEVVHDELIDCGLRDRNIHILSDADADVERHHIRPVNSVSKTGLFSYMVRGAVIGSVLAIMMIALADGFGLNGSVTIGAPMLAGAIAIFGFCIWEAGLLGFHHRNHKFDSMQAALSYGEHLLILDYTPKHQRFVERVLRNHPRVCSVNV